MKNVLILIVLSTLLLACDRSVLSSYEKKELEIQFHYDVAKNEVEFNKTLLTLIDAGEIDEVKKMLTSMQFLNLQALYQFAHEPRVKEPEVFYILKTHEEMKEDVSKLLDKYYTEQVEQAGKRIVESPSDIRPIHESREFLDKMKRRQLSRRVLE